VLDVNTLRYNVHSIKKNTETLIDIIKDVGLEINVEKTISICCCLITRIQVKSGHKNSILIIRKCITFQVFGNDSNKSKFDSGGN
jgi:hypothetical protein